MSRISFNAMYNDKPVQITAGWDNPLQYFFMTVFGNDDDEPVWDELSNFNFDQLRTAGPLAKQLESMGITPPKGFWEKVELCEGNVVERW
jgi:hypothetical protein